MTLTTTIIDRDLGYLPELLEQEVESRLRNLFGL